MAQCSVMGVITQVFPVQSGTSEKTGNQWSRQQIIVKKITNSQYEQFVSLDLNNQNIQKVNPQVGMVAEFYFDAESRYLPSKDQSQSGRWFTSLSCYNCNPYQMQQAQPQQAQQVQPQGGFQTQQQGFQTQPQGFAPQQAGWNQPQQGSGWHPMGGNDGAPY